MFHVFDLRLPATDQIRGSAQGWATLQDCRPFGEKMRAGFDSRNEMIIGKQLHRMGKRTSVERPFKTIFSISVVMRERASWMKGSCEDTTFIERRGIGADSGSSGLFSLSTSGPSRRLPATTI